MRSTAPGPCSGTGRPSTAGIDAVMEGWRLTRLPRIDRDILRLAAVDLEDFRHPCRGGLQRGGGAGQSLQR